MSAVDKIKPSESAHGQTFPSSTLVLCPALVFAEHLPAIVVLLPPARLPIYMILCLQYLVAHIKLLRQLLHCWRPTPSSVIHDPNARLYVHKASGDPLVRGFVWQSVIFGLAGPERWGCGMGAGPVQSPLCSAAPCWPQTCFSSSPAPKCHQAASELWLLPCICVDAMGTWRSCPARAWLPGSSRG